MQTTVGKPASSSDNRGNSAELDIGAKVSSDFQKAKVLLVDDSRLIRMGLRKSLVEIGLSDITEASDGREAIETLVREPFDLMLLDMEMPEMNGMEVLAVLRDTPHQPWPPVIVISGGTSLEDAVRCIELGAEDYLSKPLTRCCCELVSKPRWNANACVTKKRCACVSSSANTKRWLRSRPKPNSCCSTSCRAKSHSV